MQCMSPVSIRDLRGPLDAFLKKVEGADGDDWLRAFNRFLRKEDPWIDTTATKWTVTSKGGRVRDLLATFQESGIYVSKNALEVLEPSDRRRSPFPVTKGVIYNL